MNCACVSPQTLEGRACKGTDEAIWFPGRGVSTLAQMHEICGRCPREVREKCFQWALHHEEFGNWAGTTPEMRVSIRRKRGITLASPATFLDELEEEEDVVA